MESYGALTEKAAPSTIECNDPDQYNELMAEVDFYRPQVKRNDDFHCFCKNLHLQENGVEKINAHRFPLDDTFSKD